MRKRLARLFVVRVVKRYSAASGGTWALAIAWNTLFAFFPIVLAITTILTFVFGSAGIGSTVDHGIIKAIPGQQGALIVEALHSYHKAAGALAIVSFVGLLWSGSSLFSAMDQGLDSLYPVKQRSFLRQKLMAVVMILVFTVLVVLAVASASLLSIVTKLPHVPSFFAHGPLAVIIQILFGALDGVLLFGSIYSIVPNRRHPLREVLPGAVAAAILFEAFTLLFPLYFKLEHGFSTYGTTFGIFFLLLTLAYWMAQIIMLGGAVNAELHPPVPGSFPRAGSSISPNAQTEADAAELRGSPSAAPAQRQQVGTLPGAGPERQASTAD